MIKELAQLSNGSFCLCLRWTVARAGLQQDKSEPACQLVPELESRSCVILSQVDYNFTQLVESSLNEILTGG